MDEFLARARMMATDSVAAAVVQAQPETGDESSDEAKRNEEKIKREQVEEERIDENQEGELEPDVVPQKEDGGVDRPLAS